MHFFFSSSILKFPTMFSYSYKPYGPKNLSGSSSSFQNIVSSSMVQIYTIQFWWSCILPNKIFKIGNIIYLTKLHLSDPPLHAIAWHAMNQIKNRKFDPHMHHHQS
jgi:hypothetical protein